MLPALKAAQLSGAPTRVSPPPTGMVTPEAPLASVSMATLDPVVSETHNGPESSTAGSLPHWLSAGISKVTRTPSEHVSVPAGAGAPRSMPSHWQLQRPGWGGATARPPTHEPPGHCESVVHALSSAVPPWQKPSQPEARTP